MDILALSKTLTHEEFDQVLKEISGLNKKGLIEEYITLVNVMLEGGTDLFSASGYAHYDLLYGPFSTFGSGNEI
jgi:hypothetical protein